MVKKENRKTSALLLFCYICLASIAQNDTILNTDGRQISCTISQINESTVFFKDKKGDGYEIDLRYVVQYGKNGVLMYIPSSVALDTGYNALFVDNININKLNIKFCEMINLDVGFHGGDSYIYIDYGQKVENPQKVVTRNNKGKSVYFNSIVSALNFMEKNGWEYVNQSVSTNGSIAVGKTATIYKFLLKRKT